MADGRFAPSPTGPLHLGNLRTALIAWLFSRSSGGRFVVRMEDLDRANASIENERRQLDDLASLGITWDGVVVRQSERFALYDAAIDRLTAAGLTYRCYCTRREIAEAASAPHGTFAEGVYPGTCRSLSADDRSSREAAGRRPAIRLRTNGEVVSFVDRVCGALSMSVDDVVLRRNDGVPAYNLAVVIDDAAQGIGEVVRGDDLLTSTPRQIHLQRLLELPTPSYAHVPLVLGTDGQRLAKRHGAVTLTDRAARGESPAQTLSLIARSLGLIGADTTVSTAVDLVDRFDPERLPRKPWRLGTELDQ